MLIKGCRNFYHDGTAVRQRGFTLLELAIVVTIIGLIVSAILVGSDMIRASEMRKIYTQQEQYITAVNAFMDKYHCLPGDCANAEEFSGRTPSNVPQRMAKAVSAYTCNGDGDGTLHSVSDGLPTHESLETWRQLADAGMITGVYSGAWPLASLGEAGYNCPQILNASGCWQWLDISKLDMTDPGQALYYPGIAPGNYGTTVLLMNWTASAAGMAQNYISPVSDAYAGSFTLPSGIGTFTPKEALDYDTKYDDGNPVTGSVMAEAEGLYNAGCTTQDANGNIIYDTSQSMHNCNFFYRTTF